jgi:hypothetical protein
MSSRVIYAYFFISLDKRPATDAELFFALRYVVVEDELSLEQDGGLPLERLACST